MAMRPPGGRRKKPMRLPAAPGVLCLLLLLLALAGLLVRSVDAQGQQQAAAAAEVTPQGAMRFFPRFVSPLGGNKQEAVAAAAEAPAGAAAAAAAAPAEEEEAVAAEDAAAVEAPVEEEAAAAAAVEAPVAAGAVAADEEEAAAAPAAGAAAADEEEEQAPAAAVPAADEGELTLEKPVPGGPADEPLPDGEEEEDAAVGAVKPAKPKVPALDDMDEEDEEDDKPARGKTKTKKGKATTKKSTKRPTYNAAAAEHWQTVPAVEVEVNSYEDEDGAVCSRDSPTCNLRAALTFVGNRQGTIRLPTVEVHKLKKGPILVPMYAHVTITSIGTAAQKKAVIYHRESSNFGGGNSAVLMVPENTTLTLDAVAFKNNPRRALYGDKGAELTVIDCAFVNNTFDAEGATIRVDGGILTINQTLFYNNTDWSSGGAIYTTYSTLTIESTNFLNNSASSGGAIKTYQSEVDIHASHFGGGTAWADGGALEFVESTGRVYDNIMEYNIASSGGCVKLVGSNITFSGIEFQKNKCKNTGAVFDAYLSNTTIEGCLFRRNHALNVGGCISGYQTQYNTYDNLFELNKAESAGGVVSLLEAQLFDFSSTFQNNTAFMGGVVNVEEDAYAHLRGSLLKGNIATGDGAAVRIAKAHVYLEDVLVINNTVVSENGGAAIFGEGGYLDAYLGTYTNHTNVMGPVVHVVNTTTNFNSTLFRFNAAETYAGAVWIENSEFMAYNTTFFSNTATKGGAVFIQNEVTQQDKERPKFFARHIRFVDSVFLENVALDAGGGIEMSGAENVSTIGGMFQGNNASEFGGAVHMESSNATFTGTSFLSNFAKFGAAVETFISEFRVVNCTMDKNLASWGGAMEFKESIFKCTDSSITRNHATFDGGALNCQNSTLELTGCRMNNNLGENNAGAFWLETSNMTATGSTFRNNKADARDGGAVFALDTNTRFRSCDFGGNEARSGEALFNHGGLAEIYCARIGHIYNKPKVGGHIVQDCFTCPAGRYGDYESAGSSTCAEQCHITSAAIGCFECPFENACEGKRTCKPGYRGEQCMECKRGWVELDGHCLHMAAVSLCVLAGFAILAAYCWYLHKGPVLDANQFTRVKILYSLLQLIVMIGLIHEAFGTQVVVFLAILKPLALWFDFGTVASFAKHGFAGVFVVNTLFPAMILVGLLQASNLLYKKRIYFTDTNVPEALKWLKYERRLGQFTALFAEMSYAPLLYNAAKAFDCYDTTQGRFLVWDTGMQCHGAGLFFLRSISVGVFVLAGVVFPLVLRYILVTIDQQGRTTHPNTREMYKALYESYTESRMFYDLVLLGHRAALLLPLLASTSGFVQAMAMLALTGLYYFHYRGNSPFIPFEDDGDLERPNLHYKAEESKVGVVSFWLVAAAIGAKQRDMSEICGWVFVLLNSVLLFLVFRNLVVGVQNVNREPEEAHIIAAQNARAVEESLKALGASGDSENSGPQPADEGFLSYLRSFLFPPTAAINADSNSTDAPAVAATAATGGSGVLGSLMARIRKGRKGAASAGVDEAEGEAAATVIAIAPSPGKGAGSKKKRDNKEGKEEGGKKEKEDGEKKEKKEKGSSSSSSSSSSKDKKRASDASATDTSATDADAAAPVVEKEEAAAAGAVVAVVVEEEDGAAAGGLDKSERKRKEKKEKKEGAELDESKQRRKEKKEKKEKAAAEEAAEGEQGEQKKKKEKKKKGGKEGGEGGEEAAALDESKRKKEKKDKARSKSSSTAAIAAPEQLQEQREQQPAEEVGGDAAPAPVPLESQVAADAVTDVVAAGAEEQA